MFTIGVHLRKLSQN